MQSLPTPATTEANTASSASGGYTAARIVLVLPLPSI
jgi:hypothetical protein